MNCDRCDLFQGSLVVSLLALQSFTAADVKPVMQQEDEVTV